MGAGAHGKLTHSGVVERTTRHRQPREYLSRPIAERLVERRIVSAAELPFEYMLNALRLRDGFDLAHFELRTGLHRSAIAQPLKLASEKQLLEEVRSGYWKPTDFGARFLNDLHGLFLPQ